MSDLRDKSKSKTLEVENKRLRDALEWIAEVEQARAVLDEQENNQ